MSSPGAQHLSRKLRELLPEIYRLKNDQMPEGQRPLEDLLGIIAEEVAGLEENLEQFYDDQFIETCADWVVPYIGDLIGCRDLSSGPGLTSLRAEVANTIAYRRRKGTAAVLEQLARDVTGWDARVVEFFKLISATQNLNHLRPECKHSPNLRDRLFIERVGTAFDETAHTVNVRGIARRGGRYNIPNVGVFLWRLREWPLTNVAAVSKDARRFFFNPLAVNTQLVNLPEKEDSITHLAEPVNTPINITRRALHRDLNLEKPRYFGRSLRIWLDGKEQKAEDVIACDLSNHPADTDDWAHLPDKKVAIDPELGRIALPPLPVEALPPEERVRVTFHYASLDALGGGEYERDESIDRDLRPLKTVGDNLTLDEAIKASAGLGAVEIGDSGTHSLKAATAINAQGTFELRAADEKRPAVRLSGDLTIAATDNATVTLSGLVVTGGRLIVPGGGNKLKQLRLLHCTLLPGRNFNKDGEPAEPLEPSLVIESESVEVEIDHCILGDINCHSGSRFHITNSAVGTRRQNPVAFSALDGDEEQYGGTLYIEKSTVVGEVHTRALEYAANTIFAEKVFTKETQKGCTRFCYVPEDSRVPRQFRCQPSLAAKEAYELAKEQNPDLTDDEWKAIAARERRWITPAFTSQTYGSSAYLQLDSSCPAEICSGSEHGSEMGVYHDLYQTKREDNLKLRFEEYLRVGLEAGIIYVS